MISDFIRCRRAHVNAPLSLLFLECCHRLSGSSTATSLDRIGQLAKCRDQFGVADRVENFLALLASSKNARLSQYRQMARYDRHIYWTALGHLTYRAGLTALSKANEKSIAIWVAERLEETVVEQAIQGRATGRGSSSLGAIIAHLRIYANDKPV